MAFHSIQNTCIFHFWCSICRFLKCCEKSNVGKCRCLIVVVYMKEFSLLACISSYIRPGKMCEQQLHNSVTSSFEINSGTCGYLPSFVNSLWPKTDSVKLMTSKEGIKERHSQRKRSGRIVCKFFLYYSVPSFSIQCVNYHSRFMVIFIYFRFEFDCKLFFLNN